MTEWVEQQIYIKSCIKLEHSSTEVIQIIQKAAVMGNWWLADSSQQCARSCIRSCVECVGETSYHSGDWAPYSPDLAPCDFWLFPKLKSPLKGKRFQTASEIQKNTTRQLIETGRTVWGPKVHTLKGPEVSLSYVQCFLSLVSSSINVYIYAQTHTLVLVQYSLLQDTET